VGELPGDRENSFFHDSEEDFRRESICPLGMALIEPGMKVASEKQQRFALIWSKVEELCQSTVKFPERI
jgi:hypothetical protein